MAADSERQYVTVSPPTQSNTAGVGVTILAATTTAANAAVPASLFHRYVDIVAEGDKIWIAFGANGAPNVDKSKAGAATFTLGTNIQNAIPLADGTGISVRLDPGTHAQISWQANSANSKLYIHPSSQASRI